MLVAHLAVAALALEPASQTIAAPPVVAEAAPPQAAENADTAQPLEDVPSTLVLVTSEELATPAETLPEASPSPGDIDLAAPKPFPDPLEPINRVFYAISQPIDKFVIRPLAMTYKAVVPKPARDGARNAISNLGEPVVFVNDLLQLRPGRALRTLGRFLINSTLGLGGLIDIAKRTPFHLGHRSNSLGSTLGYYGIGPLIYVYLPVLGPTTLRDYPAQFFIDSRIGDEVLDKVMHPQTGRRLLKGETDTSPAGTVITVVDGLDQRVENDFELKTFQEDSVDPYAALRANFLQDRAGEIAALRAKDGEAPKSEAFDDPLVDPESKPPAP